MHRSTQACWWFVTRKLGSTVGGMEQLSRAVTSRLGQRRPVRVVAASNGLSRLPASLIVAALRVLGGCIRREIGVLHLGDPVLAPIGSIARVFGVPVVMSIHGRDVVYPNVLYQLWLRAFLGGCSAYICISGAVRNAAIEAGVPADRIHVIGIGIDIPGDPDSAVARADDRLLFVGRLVERKGLAWFIEEVLPRVAADRPGLRLEVIGDGPHRSDVVAASVRAGMSDRLLWHGVASEAAKHEAYARATICVMPNIAVPGDMEGFGIVALEASASGCPLMAARIDGLVDAVADGESGMLVASGEADCWVVALQSWLNAPTARIEIGQRAREYAAIHLRWDDIIDQYENVFVQVASDARRQFASPHARGRPR